MDLRKISATGNEQSVPRRNPRDVVSGLVYTMHMKKWPVLLLLVLLCAACRPEPAHAWQTVAVYNEHHPIMSAGFYDETFAITGGVGGIMYYSVDGGASWQPGSNQSDCIYGLEILDHLHAWACGGMTNMRRSVDGGRSWQAIAAFADAAHPSPCNSISFVDENNGWLASYTLFASTRDGGQHWSVVPSPAEGRSIASTDTYAPGQGYLLDEIGTLYSSQDDGAQWEKVAQLPLGDFRILKKSAFQQAAMRFSDAGHGLLVLSGQVGQTGRVLAFHTSDGGRSWSSEQVPVAAGPVYLSRDGRLLTVITGPNILTLLRYE